MTHRPNPVLTFSFAVLAAVSGTATAQPQSLRFETFKVEHGLSNNQVNCILQDRRGYLWIGTIDGLNRYDGYSFTAFKHDPHDTNSLSDGYVLSMAEDREGFLWVGTRAGGINRFDPATNTVKRFGRGNPDSGDLLSSTVYFVHSDASGNIWAGCGGDAEREAVSRYDRSSGRFVHHFLDSSGGPRGNIFGPSAIAEDRQGNLWIGSLTTGLYCLTPSTGETVRYPVRGDESASGRYDSIRALAFDAAGNLWVGTWSAGVAVFDPGRRSVIREGSVRSPWGGFRGRSVRTLLADRRGSVWVGMWSEGLFVTDALHPERDARHFTFDPKSERPGGLSHYQIRTVYEDRAGNVWIGTQDGLNKASRNRDRFRHFTHDPEDPASLRDKLTTVVMEDRHGTVWVGTDRGGLNRFDDATETFTAYRHHPGDNGSLSSDDVKSLYEGPDGALWAGTWYRGLNRFDRTTGGFVRYGIGEGGGGRLHDASVNSMLDEGNGILWIATEEGLSRWDRTAGTFTKVSSVPDDALYELTADPAGTLWMGSWDSGLIGWRPDDGRATVFRPDDRDTTSISSVRVVALERDSSGVIWIGTHGGGLNRFDARTGVFTHISTKEGLASDMVSGILPDDHGILWLSTHAGLSRYDPRSASIRNYGLPDGLPSLRLRAGWRRANGEFVVSTFADGIFFFHPDSLVDNPHPPSVVISRLGVFDRTIPLGDTRDSARKPIVFGPSDDYISFEYAALDFTAPEKNRYRHLLEGYDLNWIEAGTRRFASYTNLPAGDYVFRVMGSNSDGVWSTEGAALSFSVQPPFWRTWWFIGIVVAALISLAGVIYHLRVSKLIAIERLRLKLAGDLHDDLGSNLSGIALMAELVGSAPVPERERERLRSISASARSMADSLKDLVWMIGPEHDTFDDLHLRLKDTAAVLLSAIPYTFSGGEDLASRPMSMESRRHIFLIFKEILHNIVKHSGATAVEITIRGDDGGVELRIADNGRGYVAAETREGNGLPNLRKRAAALGGGIVLESAAGKGTVATLRVKIP